MTDKMISPAAVPLRSSPPQEGTTRCANCGWPLNFHYDRGDGAGKVWCVAREEDADSLNGVGQFRARLSERPAQGAAAPVTEDATSGGSARSSGTLTGPETLDSPRDPQYSTLPAVPQGAAAEPTRDGAIPEGFLLVKASVWDALRQSLASAEARETKQAERELALRVALHGIMAAAESGGYTSVREVIDDITAALSPSPSEPAR